MCIALFYRKKKIKKCQKTFTYMSMVDGVSSLLMLHVIQKLKGKLINRSNFLRANIIVR